MSIHFASYGLAVEWLLLLLVGDARTRPRLTDVEGLARRRCKLLKLPRLPLNRLYEHLLLLHLALLAQYFDAVALLPSASLYGASTICKDAWRLHQLLDGRLLLMHLHQGLLLLTITAVEVAVGRGHLLVVLRYRQRRDVLIAVVGQL